MLVGRGPCLLEELRRFFWLSSRSSSRQLVGLGKYDLGALTFWWSLCQTNKTMLRRGEMTGQGPSETVQYFKLIWPHSMDGEILLSLYDSCRQVLGS